MLPQEEIHPQYSEANIHLFCVQSRLLLVELPSFSSWDMLFLVSPYNLDDLQMCDCDKNFAPVGF